MKRSSFLLLAAAGTLITVAACSDSSTSPTQSSIASQELTAAFQSTPAGFSSTENSFSASGDDGEPWMPDREARDDGHMMGGGMGPEFFGGAAFGRGFDHGPFGFGYFLFNCSFSSTTGRVTCEDVTRGGLTISRSFEFWDATGAVQPFPNDKTDKIDVTVAVSGTVVRHDKRDTSKVAHNSDRVVSGLVAGATQRKVDGGSKGTEATSGTTKDGTKFTASRLVADTVKGLVIPLQDGHPTFPTAGTITRIMQATLTLGTAAPVTRSRTEVITFDGSSTAKVVITKDGTTKNCTLPLPFGELTCK